MSNTIDNRVLEMRFDNAQFEKGVSTSMSTLEKLKQKLNLKGASKGLEDVGKAAKNVNFNGMTAGIDTVTAKFSALQVAGVTAMANITNQAVNAGKRMVSALTIDPVKTGFQEYETQIGAIQTILANTMKEGTNVEIVNSALDELNKYADQTIYNFTEMTRNIGTFTAAGVKLDDSVNAIKGIANLAAVSGSTSAQASSAMYQLSQALAAGRVSLMDWNSVVNAGMGGQLFQDSLIRTSELLGTGAKKSIEAYGSFRESLTQGQWLTTEVLTETLSQLAGVYDKAELMQQGYTEAQADEIVKLAETAVGAATEVKTFTQLWDTMKEAVQSGWSQTWRTIIGDFDEAKELMTGLSNFFGGIIGKSADNRNAIVEGAFAGNPFTKLGDKIEKITGPVDKLKKTTDEVSKSAEKAGDTYEDLANKIIAGEFGQGQERIEKLTKAGYDWAHAQNLVNEKLGSSIRHATDYKESQKGIADAQKKTSNAQKQTIEDLLKLNDAELRNLGFTKDEVEAFRELEKQSELTGIPLEDLVKDLDQLNGRTLLINSFKNAASGLGAVFGSISDAWRNIFWDGASDEDILARKTEMLYNAIATIHRFSTYLTSDKVPVDELTRSFKGLFAVIDIVATIAGGGFKLAFEALSSILGAFDMNILEFTANLGDAIVGFRDWLFESNSVSKAIEKLVDKLPDGVAKIKEWVDAFKETPAVEAFASAIEKIGDAFKKLGTGEFSMTDLAHALGENLANALMSIPEIAVQIGKDVIAGFQNGIKEGISGSIIGDIVSFCLEFISSFAEALGVQSPSWKTHDIAVDTIQGFINGIKEMLSPVINVVKWIGEQIVNAFKFIFDLVTDESGNIEWDKMFSGGVLITGALMVKSFVDAIDGVADAIGGIGDILENAGDALQSFSKVLNGFAWDLKAKALMKMAISIGILAGVIALLGQLSWSEIGKGVAAVGALAGVMVLLGLAMDKFGDASVKFDKSKGKLNINGLKTTILQMGLALLMLGVVVKLVGGMDPDAATQGFIAMTAMMIELGAFIAIIGHVMKGNSLDNVDKIGKLMTKLSIAMLLMVAVVKLASGLSSGEMLEGAIFAGAFALFVNSITNVAKKSGKNISKVGSMVLKLSIAMGLMVGVVKLVGMLSPDEMFKGAIFATAFGIFVRTLVKSVTYAKGNKIAKIGGLILSISISIGLMAAMCKIVGTLSIGELTKGIVFVGAFVLFVKTLIKVATIGKDSKIAKLAGTLISMSVAIGILAGVSALLGLLDIGALAKGIGAVGLLTLMMSSMIKGLQGVKKIHKTVMMLAVVIGVMAGAVVALSMIDTGDLLASAGSLAVLMGTFALITNSMKGLGNIKMGSLAGMIGVVVALSVIVAALSLIPDPSSTIEIVASIGLLMLSLASTMEILDGVGKISKNALISMGILSLLAVGIGTVLALLTKLNPGPTMEIATSLSTVLLAMSASALILSKIGPLAGAGVKGAAAFLVLVTVAGLILAGIGGLIAYFPKAKEFLEKGIPVIEMIGTALGSLIGGIIGGIGEGITNSLPNIANNISTFMENLGTAGENAAKIKPGSFDGVKQLIETLGEIALLTVGTSLSDVFTLGGTSMEKFETDGVAFFEAIGEISKASNGVTLDDVSFDGIKDLIEAIGKIGETTKSTTWSDIFTLGGSSMEKFKTDGVAFFTAMSEISKAATGIKMPEDSMNNIIDMATDLADLQSVIEPIGGLAAAFTGSSSLGSFGRSVSNFINEIISCFTSINTGETNFDTSKLTVIIDSATKLTELQGLVEPIGGLAAAFTGSSSLGSFGRSVSNFIFSISTAFEGLNDTTIDESTTGKITSIVSAGREISKLQELIEPIGGFMSAFKGTSDLGTFGSTVGTFISSIGTAFSGLNDTTIPDGIADKMVEVSKTILTLNDSLPEEGWFDGKMNLDEFSRYISKFGTAMGDFGTKSAEINPESMNTAITAANRIKTLINNLGEVNTENLDAFAGGGFSSGAVSKIATAIKDFGEKASGIETENITVAITSANRLRSFIASLAGFDSSGTENFKPGPIGKEMKAFAKSVNGIDTGAVTVSITAATRLKSFISGLAGFDSSGVANFKPAPLGTAMKGYSSSVAGVDAGAVSSSITAATRVKSFIESLSGFDGSGVGSFQSAIATLSQTNVSSLVATFNAAGPLLVNSGSELIHSFVNGMQSASGTITAAVTNILSNMTNLMRSRSGEFRAIGTTLMGQFVNGIRSQSGAVVSATVSGLGSATSAARGYYGSFYSAGSYAGSGMAAGIRSQSGYVASVAASMAASAAAAARANLRIHSPSRVFRDIGKYVPQGFAQGIGMFGNTVKRSITKMTSNAVNTTEGAMGAMLDLLNGDMDSRPTIRPVVDLDDVKSGVNTMNKLFDKQQSIGLMSKLNSLSIQMGERNQNGANADVVSAIERLRRGLDNLPSGDSYTFGDIAYSDNSAISDAVNALIRAVKVERRA